MSRDSERAHCGSAPVAQIRVGRVQLASSSSRRRDTTRRCGTRSTTTFARAVASMGLHIMRAMETMCAWRSGSTTAGSGQQRGAVACDSWTRARRVWDVAEHDDAMKRQVVLQLRREDLRLVSHETTVRVLGSSRRHPLCRSRHDEPWRSWIACAVPLSASRAASRECCCCCCPGAAEQSAM